MIFHTLKAAVHCAVDCFVSSTLAVFIKFSYNVYCRKNSFVAVAWIHFLFYHEEKACRMHTSSLLRYIIQCKWFSFSSKVRNTKYVISNHLHLNNQRN